MLVLTANSSEPQLFTHVVLSEFNNLPFPHKLHKYYVGQVKQLGIASEHFLQNKLEFMVATYSSDSQVLPHTLKL